MGRYKGIEARYNVLSVRLDDDMNLMVRARVPAGVSLSDFVREMIRRECSVCLVCGYPLDAAVNKSGCPNCGGGPK